MAPIETSVTEDGVAAVKLEWAHPACSTGGVWNVYRFGLFPELTDLSQYEAIHFWAKGSTVGSMQFRIFSDTDGAGGNTDFWKEGARYMFAPTAEWTEHIVPLDEFAGWGGVTRPLDWTTVTAIELAAGPVFDAADPGTVSTLYIDDVWALAAGN